MESPQPHDTDATSDERTSPKGTVLEGAALRELARSIIGQPAIKASAVELTQQGSRRRTYRARPIRPASRPPRWSRR